MNNTWVKLYRKTLDNGILKDHKAWAVFTWFLLMVDKDSGKRTFGRFQLSDELGIKPNTLYKIVKRLEKKYKVIKTISKTNHTEVLIVNWDKYQHIKDVQSNDSQTPVKQEATTSNTKQELRIKNIDISGKSPEFKNKEWQEKALQAASFLKVKVPKEFEGRWFKFFREIEGTDKAKNLTRALGYVVDHPNARTPEQKILLFFSLAQNGFQIV